MAKNLKNIEANQDKFASAQMDELLGLISISLDEQIVISEDLVEKIKLIENDRDDQIHELY